MMRLAKHVLAAICGVCLSAVSAAQAEVIVKVADEFGTIQPAGARAPTGGNRFWNIQGGTSGNFASSGTLRFYIEDVVNNLNTTFPQGWVVTNVTLVAEHSNSGFTTAGGVSIFHFTNDSLAITNDATVAGDALPGAFAGLGASPLRYSDAATDSVSGQPVRVTTAAGPANMGVVTRVNDYSFAVESTDDLDVFGLELEPPGITPYAVDPLGAVDKAPTYGLKFPDVAGDTLATFNTEIASGGGYWLASGFGAILSDIQSGADPLSFIFAATQPNSSVVATYKGNPFGSTYPPRLYIEAHAVPEPASLALFGVGSVLSLAILRRRRPVASQLTA